MSAKSARPESSSVEHGSAKDPAPDLGDLRHVSDVGLGSTPELDDVDVHRLLRDALGAPPSEPPPSLLRGVQERLREESRGRFYGDGWSRVTSPRVLFLGTSALMLLVALACLLLLRPSRLGPLQ
jgi:hypothetical protein